MSARARCSEWMPPLPPSIAAAANVVPPARPTWRASASEAASDPRSHHVSFDPRNLVGARRTKRQERRIAMEAVHDQPAAASPASIRWKHQSLSRRTPPSSRQLVHTALSGPRDAYESTFESSFGVPASPAPPPEQFTWDPRGHSLESERSLESTPRAGRLAPAYEAWLNRKKAQVAPRDYPRSDIIRHHHPSIIDLHAERDPIRSTPGTPSRP